jgi:hypothetical protein
MEPGPPSPPAYEKAMEGVISLVSRAVSALRRGNGWNLNIEQRTNQGARRPSVSGRSNWHKIPMPTVVATDGKQGDDVSSFALTRGVSARHFSDLVLPVINVHGGAFKEVGDLVRAGPKRLHGRRVPPVGLGLDAKGPQAPPQDKRKVSRRLSLIQKREGSLPEGRRRRRRLREGPWGRVEPVRHSRTRPKLNMHNI